MFNSRTYGTKGAKRRLLQKRNVEEINESESPSSASDDSSTPARKKPRVQPLGSNSDEDEDRLHGPSRQKASSNATKLGSSSVNLAQDSSHASQTKARALYAGHGSEASRSAPKLVEPPISWPSSKPPSKANTGESRRESLIHTTARQPTTPTRLSKRMLSRSRTEPSVVSSGPSAAGSTSSITGRSSVGDASRKSLSPSKSLPAGLLSADAPSPSIPAGRPPNQPLASKHARTYGGASRSFLVSLSLPSDPGASQVQEDDLSTRESYSSLRARWGVDGSEDDFHPPLDISPSNSRNGTPSKNKGKGKAQNRATDLPQSMMNDLRSITELRSKGESRRFLDEVGYLFEGMDAKGAIGLRRASAIEIINKLCDTQFARKAKAADFLCKIWDVMRDAGAGQGDKVLDIALASFIAVVARDPKALEELAVQVSANSLEFTLTRTLFRILDSSRSLDALTCMSLNLSAAEAKRYGLSKNEVMQLKSLYKVISADSAVFPISLHLSTALLVSHSLCTLNPRHLPTSELPRLLATVKEALSYFFDRLAAYSSGLSLFPSSDTPEIILSKLLHAENCLRLLESFVLDHWSVQVEDAVAEDLSPTNQDWLLQRLVSISIVMEIVQRQSGTYSKELGQHATSCAEITFRVFMSLTHDEPGWCAALLDQELGPLHIVRTVIRAHKNMLPQVKREPVDEQVMVKQEDDSVFDFEEDDRIPDVAGALALDRLCLALALLTNLIQGCEDAQDTFRNLRLDPRCRIKRGCIRSCSCPNAASSLDAICGLYTDYLKPDISTEFGSDFISGHLSILLGMLMRGSKVNQTQILAALPGPTNRSKLNTLIERSREFTAFYKTLMFKLQQSGGPSEGLDENGRLSAGSRSQDIRKTQEAGEKIDATAKEIITLLEDMQIRCLD
ncbi:WAPL family protein [Pleurotus pulmonarius]